MAEIPTPILSAPAATTKRRPTGITVLAALLIFYNIYNLMTYSMGVFFYGGAYAAYLSISSIIGLILGIALWQMFPWARKAAIIWEAIGLILGLAMAYLFGTVFGGIYIMAMLISMIPSAIIAVIIIGYLMQGSIKAAFEGTTVTEAW